MKNLLIVLTLIFSTSVIAKNRVSSNTKTICRPKMEQCQKAFRALLKLDRSYNDIDFKMDACKYVGDQVCMEGELNLEYWVKPTQRVSMMLDETSCNAISRTTRDVSGEGIDCDLKCSWYLKNFGRSEAGLYAWVFLNKWREDKQYDLKGQCSIK